MKSYNKIITGLIILFILAFLNLVFVVKTLGQERIQVKILKIEKDSVTKVTMKTISRPRVKLKTTCVCEVPFRRKDIVWINKPF